MFKDFTEQAYLSTIKERVYADKKYETFLSDWPLYKHKPTKTTLDSLINLSATFYLPKTNFFSTWILIQTQNITLQIS
jgi:hypothetical protein